MNFREVVAVVRQLTRHWVLALLLWLDHFRIVIRIRAKTIADVVVNVIVNIIVDTRDLLVTELNLGLKVLEEFNLSALSLRVWVTLEDVASWVQWENSIICITLLG
jgi:hypothetical protein